MKKIFALLLALVMVFSLAACGGDKKDDTTAANTYLSMAQEFLDKGDIDSALDILNKGFAETNDPRLSKKLVEIYAQRDSTKETGTSTTIPSATTPPATNPPAITFPDRDISAGIQQPTESKKPEPSLTEAQITEKLKESMVKVICYDYDGTTEMSHGSGFFIDSYGTFITSAQVVKDCFYIKITTHLGETYDVDIMHKYESTASDYAICKVGYFLLPKPVEFATTAVTGQTVYAIGCPGDDFALSTTSGKITNAYATEGTKHYYANTARIGQGSRGGVLVNAQGKVLGITTGSLANGEYAALKYQDFEDEIRLGLYSDSKKPLEHFHTEDDVASTSYKLEENFDVNVNATKVSDKQMSYQITLKLKDKYKDAKVVFDPKYNRICLKVVTKYTYTAVKSTGTSNETQKYTNLVWFTFDNKSELFIGDTQSASSTAIIASNVEYYDMDISYEVTLGSNSGAILIYDKDK